MEGIDKRYFCLRICLLWVSFLAAAKCYAQRQDILDINHEFAIGIGGPTSIRHDNESWIDCAAASSFVRYSMYLSTRIAVGGEVGYAWGHQGVGEDWKEYWDGDVHVMEQNVLDYRHYNSLYLIGSAKWTYVNNKHFGMYMRAGIGLQRQRFWYDGSYNLGGTYDISQVRAAYHLSPLAIEGGLKHIHVYLEIGYGMEDIFNAGISYRY